MITEIVLASRNRKKIAEIESIFREYGLGHIRLLSLDDIGYTGEIEENGASFEENSKIKASVPASLGYYGIADDSGLMVDALDGRPGFIPPVFRERAQPMKKTIPSFFPSLKTFRMRREPQDSCRLSLSLLRTARR